MALFQNTLLSIAEKAQQLTCALGEESAALLNNNVDNGPFDGDPAIPPPSDEAWDLAQAMVTDFYQMIAILTPRHIQTLKFSFAASLETAIGIAAHFRVADLIEKRGGRASVDDLATDADTDANKLTNVLRALTARHMFVELETGVFANNRHSRTLLGGHGAPEMIESYALVSGKAFDGLLPVMTDKSAMHSIDPRDGAFARAVGVPKGITEWIMLPENEAHLAQLVAGIPWLTSMVAHRIVHEFDWRRWGPTARICDMGCADGGIMSLIKAETPSLHIICQDLKATLPMTRQTFALSHPGAEERNEVEFIAHSYFDIQTTEADAYWLRGVLHDYTDADCVRILHTVANQLQQNPQARVLINEIVKPSMVVPEHDKDAPASNAAVRTQSAFLEMSSLMQLHTTAFLAGKERSYDEFQLLFAQAGYRIARYHHLHLFTAIMELELVQ
ncbi:hypothetical protein SEUCBS140593_010349 [Sporothrix eucalyptigena]|uniref:O-methyltransferase domain-containing protein n=1 Tax=Sporothrix eucalyptigena TaxID=1812306 RepID=A0ABP0D140_9PEZI